MAELRRDKVDWQFIHYGNPAHSFTDPEADRRKMRPSVPDGAGSFERHLRVCQ